MSVPVLHPAITWASEEGKARHAAWVAEERARIRTYRLGRARYDHEFKTCDHPHRGPCATCAAQFKESGLEITALATLDGWLAAEEAEALALPPVVTFGEHWEAPHPETGEVVQGLLMGAWRGGGGLLAVHPLGPDRKSNPALAFPIALPTLLARGRRWT